MMATKASTAFQQHSTTSPSVSANSEIRRSSRMGTCSSSSSVCAHRPGNTASRAAAARRFGPGSSSARSSSDTSSCSPSAGTASSTASAACVAAPQCSSANDFSGPLAGAASPLAAASPAGAEVAVAAAAGVGALPERLSSGGSTDAMWLLSTGEATGASSVSACRLYIMSGCRISLGSTKLKICGRTPRMTRRPSRHSPNF
mmetsp:Transcript_27054/g.73104  ORF Transcript_27054/g.73104 Transcript_27054/m.73104 type:complete len:202 (-) Transcript_27054:2961-3566(-)